jgi:hypothetical protein
LIVNFKLRRTEEIIKIAGVEVLENPVQNHNTHEAFIPYFAATIIVAMRVPAQKAFTPYFEATIIVYIRVPAQNNFHPLLQRNDYSIYEGSRSKQQR